MADVDAVAAKSLSAWVKANCKHKVTAIGKDRVCRPCAIDWATSGCYTAVLLEREACAMVVENDACGHLNDSHRERIAGHIRERTLKENFA